MKKLVFVVIILFSIQTLGCIGGDMASVYKKVTLSELKSQGPNDFPQVIVEGVIDNNSLDGIHVIHDNNTYMKGIPLKSWNQSGFLANVMGHYNFEGGRIKAHEVKIILSVFTEKYVYQPNETINVHVEFDSAETGQGQIQVLWTNNALGRALISETREETIKKDINGFDFQVKTPSCKECSSFKPEIYFLNVTVNINDRSFETYKTIKLESESK